MEAKVRKVNVMRILSNPFASKNGNGHGPNGGERRNPKERQKKNGELLTIPPEVREASVNLTKVCDSIIYEQDDDQEVVVV